jgi:hypothetical protein
VLILEAAMILVALGLDVRRRYRFYRGSKEWSR